MSGSYWLINPPKPKRRRTVKRKTTRKTSARRSNRRNPGALALYGNPGGSMAKRGRKKNGQFTKGKKSTRRKSTRRASSRATTGRYKARRAAPKSRRKSYRRNPGMLTTAKGLIPAPKRILAGAVGVAATRLLPGVIHMRVPQVPIDGPAGLAVKSAVAILGGVLIGKFAGRQFGEDFAFGGIAIVADQAAREYVYPAIGLDELAAYVDPELHAYVGVDDDLDAYMEPQALPSGGSEGMSGLPERLSVEARI